MNVSWCAREKNKKILCIGISIRPILHKCIVVGCQFFSFCINTFVHLSNVTRVRIPIYRPLSSERRTFHLFARASQNGTFNRMQAHLTAIIHMDEKSSVKLQEANWMLKIENQAKTRVKCIFSSAVYRICIHSENQFIVIHSIKCRNF